MSVYSTFFELIYWLLADSYTCKKEPVVASKVIPLSTNSIVSRFWSRICTWNDCVVFMLEGFPIPLM